MRGEDFLKYAGLHYEENRKKWSARLKKLEMAFSDDLFQDSIIHVYDSLNKKELDETIIEAYWYKTFLTNTRRDGHYSYHKRDDSIDILAYLDAFPNDDPPILLEDIASQLKRLDIKELYLLFIYYLTDITYTELEELTNIKDVKYKIKKIIEKIKGNKKEKGTK